MSDVDNNFYKILKNNPSPGIFESIFSTLFLFRLVDANTNIANIAPIPATIATQYFLIVFMLCFFV